jgi:hypothetical protein
VVKDSDILETQSTFFRSSWTYIVVATDYELWDIIASRASAWTFQLAE